MTSRLTRYQHEVLEKLKRATGRTREGDGPWTRSWAYPISPAESRAMARLHSLGLIERRPGRPSAKIPHGYRWRAEP